MLAGASIGIFMVSECGPPKLERGAPVNAQSSANAPGGDAAGAQIGDGSSATGDACGSDASPGVDGAAHVGSVIRYIFVIAMENDDAAAVYGARDDWPYLNSLLPQAARALAFQDELPTMPSEPHYVWMEAGTNVFADHTFTDDSPPSPWNSTGTPDHLVTQIASATNGVDWMSYQEGLNAQTGACPVSGAGFYCPRHNPFMFFRDVIGTPPSAGAPICVAHHRPLSSLADDLAAGSVKTYNFITPNLCHDAHGQPGCPSGDLSQMADQWLSGTLPALLSFVNARDGVIFLVWDEGDDTGLIPFIALGPHVKPGYASSVTYTHSSLLKSVEEILGLPILPTVAPANDFADLFEVGWFP